MFQVGCSKAVSALAATALLVGALAEASAQKAAIVGGLRTSEASWSSYLQKKVVDTGLYPGGVDVINAGNTDPSLTQLSNYKLLLVLSSDYGLADGAGIGSVLGDYMAMVPNASLLLFTPYTWQTGLGSDPAISDKFLANYALLSQTGTATQTAAKRGMAVSSDPLTSGVPAFTCGTRCTRLTGLMPRPGATVAAYWDDGEILAVHGSHRVDLNMMPADDSVISGSFSSDGGALITNAILYLGSSLIATPGNVTFPSTPLGSSSAPITVTFKNISTRPLSVTGISLTGASKAQFSYKSTSAPTVAAPLTVGAGSSFPVEVRFKPQLQGTHPAAIAIDVAGLSRVTTAITGTSLGNLYVFKSPIDFGGIPVGTTAGPVAVRIINTGTTPVDLTKPVLADTTHYELTTPLPDATVTLIAGASYPFSVKFLPGMTEGQFPSQITVTSTDPGSPLTIPVLGMAGSPQLKVAYTSVVLPDVPNGATGLPVSILLSNPGNSELTVTSITSSAPDFTVPMAPSDVSPIRIAPRDSAVFQLVFSPKDKGLRTGTLTLKSNEPPAMGMMNSDKTLAMVGTGTVPQLRVDLAQLDFGTVNFGTPAAPQTLTLYNDGDGDLKIKDVAIPMGMDADSFAASPAAPLPFLLHAGASVPVEVSFVPKQAGMLSATLRVVSDLTGMGGTAVVALKGQVNGASAQVTPLSLDFGAQKLNISATKVVTITNRGNQPLTLLTAKLVAPMGGFSATLPADNTKVMMGASVSINVSVKCVALGAVQGSIELLTDDPAMSGGTKFTVSLAATGVTNAVSITPTQLDFAPPIYVGQKSTMRIVTVKNLGSASIDNLVVRLSGPDAGDFAAPLTFKTKLLPGEATDIGFDFEPHVAKTAHTATAILEADGTAAAMMIALTGSSMSPMISVQPGMLHFENTPAGEQSAPRSLTLSNDSMGTVELEIVPPISGDFVVDTSQSMLKLNPGDLTKLSVVFAPQSTGAKSDTFVIRLKGTSINIESIALDGVAADRKTTPPASGGCTTSRNATGPSGLAGLLLASLALALGRRRRRSLSR